MIDPKPYLNRSGVIAYNKLTERQKLSPQHFLRSIHYKTYELQAEYLRLVRIEPYKEKMLNGASSWADPKVFENLAETLSLLEEKINDLENTKQDIPRDY